MLAMEAAMDNLAYAAKIEPLLLRERNFYRPGFSTTPYQQDVGQIVLPDLVQKLVARSDYWSRRENIKEYNASGPRWRKGISLNPVKFGISFTATHLNQAGALLHIFTDGSVEVNHGGTEMGSRFVYQGSSRRSQCLWTQNHSGTEYRQPNGQGAECFSYCSVVSGGHERHGRPKCLRAN